MTLKTSVQTTKTEMVFSIFQLPVKGADTSRNPGIQAEIRIHPSGESMTPGKFLFFRCIRCFVIVN